jgi:type IV secretory pathway TraG/TraD family ATPase VirD4
LVLAGAWCATAAVWLAWAAGRLAAALSGHPGAGPDFGPDFIAGLVRQRFTELWPATSPWLVLIVYLALLGVAAPLGFGAWSAWLRIRPMGDDPLPSLAGTRDIAALTRPAVTARAKRLRPSLAATPAALIRPGEAGVALGDHVRRRLLPSRAGGRVLYASWEDVALAVMAPRAGKTTALTTPAILDAPGAVLATSNKPDVWTTTAADRATTGTVWLFDPQDITHQPRTWWWNPLSHATTWHDAHRLASHLVSPMRHNTPGGEDFWSGAAHDLLACLILAAAHHHGGLPQVQTWLTDVTNREPATILAQHGFLPAARSITSRQAGAPETRDGIYETARTAASCLSDPSIMAWVTPPEAPLPGLDVAAFPTTRDTLYLLSKDGAGSAAPLVAALADQVLRAAVLAAERQGGRLDPPLLVVLDEAANICPISDLPQLYSHLGSRGIVPLTILQSYPQGARVWGHEGIAALWSAATIKIVGAGIDDARTAEDLSRLIGEHDVPVGSRTRDGTGHASWQTSTHRRRILDPGDLRALPRGHALLLATGARAAMIRLVPWYTTPHAARIEAHVAAATDAITRHARDAPAADE